MLETLSIVGGILGTGAQIYGGIQEAEANKQAGRYNARILEQRAADVDMLIADTMHLGEQAEFDLTEERRQQRGAGRVATASQNVIVGAGSAAAWEEGLDATIIQDITRLRENVAKDIRGLQSSQTALRQEAAFERWRGETGANAAYIGAVSAGISGATNLATNIYRMGGG